MRNFYFSSLWALLALTVVVVLVLNIQQRKADHPIRLNQIGFYPKAPKIAIVEGEVSGRYYLTTVDGRDSLYAGLIKEKPFTGFGSRMVSRIDFSAFTDPGMYRLLVPDVGVSYPFSIRNEVHSEIARATLKGYYFQRASTELPQRYAGKWHRSAGHSDDSVLVHPSAATAERPTGTVIRAPGGWYDAGDYNKYIVNSGITTGTLMSFYEDFPRYVRNFSLNIPESGNEIPDLLDEVLWNLRWMLYMQDPGDGGVYHKLTSARFSDMVMPERDTDARYVVQKSTAATLDFAAVMAQAARVFDDFPKQLPGLSDSCLAAAEKAWVWARNHPDSLYNQEALNRKFDPDVRTGAYGDRSLRDEFTWAAAELYVTTGDERYYDSVEVKPDTLRIPAWSKVRTLGYYSLLRHEQELTAVGKRDVAAIRRLILKHADSLVRQGAQTAYMTVMGYDASNFVWGSNSVAGNQGILLLQAYRLEPKQEYIDFALANLDYLLGRNGTGFSFLTGYGDHTPMFPHHRPSQADTVVAPVPGLLAGGPNPGQQDECTYPSDIPDQSYTDTACSYASNEIAINWNAPLVYLAGALEALQYKAGYAVKDHNQMTE